MTSEIFQPHQRPKRLTSVQLLSLLSQLTDAIADGDSMEGSITYGWSDEPGQYDVHAIFRIDNSMGQGGMIIVEDTTLLERGLTQSAAGEVKDLGDFTQHAAKPDTYEVTWTHTIEADNPVEAAEKAMALLRDTHLDTDTHRGVRVGNFEVDGREIDPFNPPYCSVQIFSGSRIDPPEWCDGVATHWDEHGEPYCDKHSAQPDPFEGRDI